jgi:DNA-binding MarR family transcriptional regulator
METRGLVRREECPSDARGSFAVLTEAGCHEIERAAPSHAASVRRNLIDLLDRDQLGQLADVAEAVVAQLLARPDAPPVPVVCCGTGESAEEQELAAEAESA